MANSRLIVPAPAKALLGFGLFSVAEDRSDPPALRGHWKSGVEWQNICPDANSTYDVCVANNAIVSGAAFPTPPAKAATAERSRWGATPFTVLVEVDCSTPGFYDVVDALVANTFLESEAFEVESIFLTGTVASTGNIALPHLAAASAVTEGDTTLQLVTANVGPTGGALDIVEALGKLEQALSACVKGEGVIHVPTELLAHLTAELLVVERDGVLYSPAGHRYAISAAYTGISPAGVLTADVRWMYGTGPVFMYRSKGRYVGNREQSLDRSVNTERRIYERTYVIGYDCCLFGVAVSTGGIDSGNPGSAS